MITDEMRRLAALTAEGDKVAADRLCRLLSRSGYGSASLVTGNTFGFFDFESFEPKRFKANEGQRYRFSFAWWPGSEDLKPDPSLKANSPRFLGAFRHWSSETGYVINQSPEYAEVLGTRPTRAMATVIISWPMDYRGNLRADQVSSLYEVHPWVMSERTYNEIREIHKQAHLGSHDLLANCVSGKFQRLEFRPITNNIFQGIKENNKEVLQVAYKDILNKVQCILPDLESHIGSRVSLEEIRERQDLHASIGTELAQQPEGRPVIDFDILSQVRRRR